MKNLTMNNEKLFFSSLVVGSIEHYTSSKFNVQCLKLLNSLLTCTQTLRIIILGGELKWKRKK